MRAAFVVSQDGLGHRVRCGALADELRSRGWDCVVLEGMGHTAADVFVVDCPEAFAFGMDRLVRIVDIPDNRPAALTLRGRNLVRPEFRVRWTGGNGAFDARNVRGMDARDLAEAMSRASLVITYGGMRAMEAACVGVPMIVIPRNGGERLNAEFLLSGGKIDGLGCKRAAEDIEELVK